MSITTSNNVKGAICMSAAMLSFTLNDAIIKGVMVEMDLFQAIFVRGILATGLMALLAWRQGAFAKLDLIRDIPLWIRTGCELMVTICFLLALANMPLANATMILQASPIFVTLGAAFFLGERVGWRRYSAILVGFLGVLIIIRPGVEGFNAFSLLALAAALMITGRDLATRRIRPEIPSAFIAFFASASVFAMGGVVTIASGSFEPVSIGQLLKLAGSAIFLLGGYLFSILAMRAGDIGFTSPFRYTSILFAILVGFAFFSEIPDWGVIVGGFIVMLTGLYTFFRERKLATEP